MTKKKEGTKVFALRLDNQTIQELDRISKQFKQDKSETIRDAIQDFIETADNEVIDLAINDYIHARIDEERFILTTGLQEVSEDLKKARKEIIEKIKKGEN